MKGLAKNFLRDELLKESVLIFSSSVLNNVFNLLFWLFMVRRLSAEEYGTLNAVVSLSMFFSIPLSIIQLMTTRFVSQFRAQERETDARGLFWHFAKGIGVFLGVILLVIFFSAPYAGAFLRIDGLAFIYLLGVGLVLTSFSGITLGALTGLQDFSGLALNNIATGLAKFFVGFTLVVCGMKALGAFVGFISSFGVTLGLSWFRLPAWMKKRGEDSPPEPMNFREVYTYFFPAGLGMLCFFLLTNMDVILVKHFFSPQEAGYYSVAQMVGKIVLFIPGAVGLVMFPKIVDAHSKGGDTKKLLKKCLYYVGLLSGIAMLVSCLFPGFVLRMLTGHRHPQPLALVEMFAVSMAFFALLNILMLYHVSLRSMPFIYLLAASAFLEGAAILLFHATLRQVLWILLLLSAAIFCIGVRVTFRNSRP